MSSEARMDMVDEAPRTPGRGGKGDRFLNENLLHAENRINVMVFGAQAIPEFWHGFRDLFGLGDDAWMKRVLIPGRQDRPDFLVLEGDVKRFWIEAELGGRNALQLGCYERARLDPPEVRSLVGPAANPANDPSLERVAAIARDAAGRIGVANRPAVEVLLSLAELIDASVRPEAARPWPQDIPAVLMELPWFCCAVAPLLDLEKAGRVLNKPTAGGSLSLRVRRGPSVRCKTDSFALLTQRGAAADKDFEVPSPQEMGRVFRPPLRESVVPLWEGLLSRVYPCWDVHKNGNRRIAIPAEILARHADDFAAIYATLRDCLTPPRDRP